MSSVQFINNKDLTKWGEACLISVGLSSKDARFVSKSLTQTSLWGIDSHGMARLPHYLNRIQAQSLNPKPEIKIENTGPCSANVDGDHGLGIVVVGEATTNAISMAMQNGIGVVGVRESSHCGAIGIYGRMIADAGLIGIVFTHSDSFVAPHNGFQKFLGTNPICISVPNEGGRPLCLDMATSTVAFNYVRNARAENHDIPGNVAYDIDGKPTQDPHSVASLRPMAEHKGYALAFMIDLLCGPLNGMPFGLNIPAMYGDLSKRRHLGSFVLAIDPLRFFGGMDFSNVVADMAKSARMQKAANREEPVLAPGDDHYATEAERLKTGIPVTSSLTTEILSWSQKLKVKIPAGLNTNLT